MHNQSSTTTRPYLIFGASGQVGGALVRQLGTRAVGVSHQAVDLANQAAIYSLLDETEPGVVINAAAYTQVDRAEQEEGQARAINGEAPRVLAHWCAQHSVPFVHYSTDYVYSGEGNAAWREDSPVAPINAYGRTKLFGDLAVAEADGDWLIFRTSWVYDAHGKNFLNTIIRLAKERTLLRIVAYQQGAPSYAAHLADATLTSLERALAMPRFPSGVYHLCNRGETNWHEFATAIIEGLRERGEALTVQTIEPIASSDYPTPAKRPLNSRLSLDKIHSVFGIEPPHWRSGLARCLRER